MLVVQVKDGFPAMAKKDQDIKLLDVRDLYKHFPIHRGIFRRIVGLVKAVDGVSFFIRAGETLGLVGESGCGKTTTGRCILRLEEPTSGAVDFRPDRDMVDLATASFHQMKTIRRKIQVIFQDLFSSLDPRKTVRDIIAEPLKIHSIGTRAERTDRIRSMLEQVGLSQRMVNRYPHAFSGGQRQRIGVARALILNPKLIVCDEPVSALDVSIQAQILNLLGDLQREFDLTYLFIAHDLSVVEHISDRVMVMYLGKIVEMAPADALYQLPRHPYSEALLSAVPVADPRSDTKRILLEGSVPDPSNPPPGCNFHTRCRHVQDVCKREEPDLVKLGEGSDHFAACHRAGELNLAGYKQRGGMK